MSGLRPFKRTGSKCENAFEDRLEFLSNYLLQPSEEDLSLNLNEKYLPDKDWKDIVKEELTETMARQQSAIWELITAERKYIVHLIIIVKLFLSLFRRLKDCGELPDINEKDIFSNITELFHWHEQFWNGGICNVLKKSRRNKTAFLLSELLTFTNNGYRDMFKRYEEYCLRAEKCIEFVQSLSKPESSNDSETTNKLKRWLRYSEDLPHCKRMKLAYLLSEPRDHISKYSVLLSSILQETSTQSEACSLQYLLDKFNCFLIYIKKQLKENLRYKELNTCLEQFEELSFMEDEEENISFHYIDFLKLPNASFPRYILNETMMKLIKRKRKEEVNTFLFTDVICMAKFNKDTKKYKIISRLYFLNKIHFLIAQHARNVIVVLYFDEVGLLADAFSLEIHIEQVDVWIDLAIEAKLRYENVIKGHGISSDIPISESTSSSSCTKDFDYFKHVKNMVLTDGQNGAERLSADDMEVISGIKGCIDLASLQTPYSSHKSPKYDKIDIATQTILENSNDLACS